MKNGWEITIHMKNCLQINESTFLIMGMDCQEKNTTKVRERKKVNVQLIGGPMNNLDIIKEQMT